MFAAKHVSVSINRAPSDVYAFASDPENLPKWAAGLSGSIAQVDGNWVAESPVGTVKVRFAERNNFGILDHDVTLPTGLVVHNPMRVVPNGDGSELMFTVYRRPEMSDREFQEDAEVVERDLKNLKAVLNG